MSEVNTIKCMVLGYRAAMFLTTIQTGENNAEYYPAYIDDFTKPIIFGGMTVNIIFQNMLIQRNEGIHETAFRKNMMMQAEPDVFVFLISVINRDSILEHHHMYYKEVTEAQPGKPILLVGTEIEQRTPEGLLSSKHISETAGKEIAKTFKASYMECDIANEEKISKMLQKIVKLAKSSSSCGLQ